MSAEGTTINGVSAADYWKSPEGVAFLEKNKADALSNTPEQFRGISEIPTGALSYEDWLKSIGQTQYTGFGANAQGYAYNKYIDSFLTPGTERVGGGYWQGGQYMIPASQNTGDVRPIDPSQMWIDPKSGLLVWKPGTRPELQTGHGGGASSGWLGDIVNTVGDIGRVVTPLAIGAAYGAAGLDALGAGEAATAAGAGEVAGGGWATAAEGLAAQEAGLTAAELAGWGGATTAGISGATAAGGLTQQAMLAEQYASLGYNPAVANSLAAADIASAGGAAGSSLAVQGGMFDTMGSAYNTYSQANKLNNAYKALTGGGATAAQGGGMATGTDWGSMFGSLVGGAGTYLGNQAALNDYQRKTEELANKVKFTPYAISSDIGQTYQDPVTGSMVSRLDPRFAEQQQAMLGAVGSNLAASQADPQLAAQDAYTKMRMLSAFPEEQQRLAMENRLLQQGMLGSTGGANQTRAMQEAMNTNAVNQQLQAINLGQTLSNNAMTRAGQAWTGAMAPTTAMQNQMGQSGQFGAYNTGNQQFNANMLNQANQAQAGLKMSGVNSMFGSPAFSSSGQQTGVGGLINQGVNWGVNQVGNWLGGNTATQQPAYGWDQYSGLMGQQDGFNWSGLEGVSAGSAQDMMLNDQWDWSW